MALSRYKRGSNPLQAVLGQTDSLFRTTKEPAIYNQFYDGLYHLSVELAKAGEGLPLE